MRLTTRPGRQSQLRWLGTSAPALFAALALTAPVGGCDRPVTPVAASATPSIGGPFTLMDQSGAPVDQRVLTGRWSIVYFGYTFCPDVCPATLTALAAAQRRLGADARRTRVIFITVDPARDTPARLREYLATPSFPRPVIGLTGTAAQIAAVAHAYGVYYRRAGSAPDYAVDHTSVVYLMSPNGRFDRPLPTSDPAEIAGQIEQAMRAR